MPLRLRYSVSLLRPLLYLLAVGTSNRDTVNVMRDYSIAMWIYEIGGLGASVAVASNWSHGCDVGNFAISFCPDYERALLQQSFTAKGARNNFHMTTYLLRATAVLSRVVVCLFHTNGSVSQTSVHRG